MAVTAKATIPPRALPMRATVLVIVAPISGGTVSESIGAW